MSEPAGANGIIGIMGAPPAPALTAPAVAPSAAAAALGVGPAPVMPTPATGFGAAPTPPTTPRPAPASPLPLPPRPAPPMPAPPMPAPSPRAPSPVPPLGWDGVPGVVVPGGAAGWSTAAGGFFAAQSGTFGRAGTSCLATAADAAPRPAVNVPLNTGVVVAVPVLSGGDQED